MRAFKKHGWRAELIDNSEHEYPTSSSSKVFCNHHDKNDLFVVFFLEREISARSLLRRILTSPDGSIFLWEQSSTTVPLSPQVSSM